MRRVLAPPDRVVIIPQRESAVPDRVTRDPRGAVERIGRGDAAVEQLGVREKQGFVPDRCKADRDIVNPHVHPARGQVPVRREGKEGGVDGVHIRGLKIILGVTVRKVSARHRGGERDLEAEQGIRGDGDVLGHCLGFDDGGHRLRGVGDRDLVGADSDVLRDGGRCHSLGQSDDCGRGVDGDSSGRGPEAEAGASIADGARAGRRVGWNVRGYLSHLALGRPDRDRDLTGDDFRISLEGN